MKIKLYKDTIIKALTNLSERYKDILNTKTIRKPCIPPLLTSALTYLALYQLEYLKLALQPLSSHLALLHASCFRNICFPLQHSLSHSANIRSAHVLAAIHLTIIDYSLPGVVSSSSCLHGFVVRLLQVQIGLPLLLNLFLPLCIPLIQFLFAVDFSLFLLVILFLHFFI